MCLVRVCALGVRVFGLLCVPGLMLGLRGLFGSHVCVCGLGLVRLCCGLWFVCVCSVRVCV